MLFTDSRASRKPAKPFQTFTLVSRWARVNEIASGGGQPSELIQRETKSVKTVRKFRLVGAALAAGILIVFGLRATAHTLPISYLFIVTDADYVHLELSFNPFELATFSEFDTNKNARLDPAEVESQGDKITHLLLENLTLLVDGKKLPAETSGIAPDADSHHATLRAHYRVKTRDATISIESNLQKITGSSHLTQVKCLRDGKQALAQMDSRLPKATFDPIAPEQKPVKRPRRSNSTEATKP